MPDQGVRDDGVNGVATPSFEIEDLPVLLPSNAFDALCSRF